MSIPYGFLKNEPDEEITNEGKQSAAIEGEESGQLKESSDNGKFYSVRSSNSEKNSDEKDADLNRKQSIFLPHLEDSEKRFIDLVSAGDVNAVKNFLHELNMFNLNCTDFQGVSALHIALYKNNEEMIKFLLKQSKMDVQDCALHAVRNNQPNILNLILNKLKEKHKDIEFSPCFDSPEFPDNVTPLMLAAQCGHYEIIDLLIKRNHIIARPHRPHCFCREECLYMMANQDPLNTAAGKLEIYKAISNPAYICHTSDDPILTVFHLVRELKELAGMYMIFHKQYEELAETTEIFAVDLIGCCRSSEEVETILNQHQGSHLRGDFQFPRLILAMDCKQKQFVAQTNVQQVLESTWIGTWYQWKSFSQPMKVLYVVPRILMLPVVIFVCLFMPGSGLAHHYSLPINRMLNYLSTYFVFLVLLYLHSNREKKGQTHEINMSGSHGDVLSPLLWNLVVDCLLDDLMQPIIYVQGYADDIVLMVQGLEGFLLLFVISYIFSTARMCLLQGPKRFFRFLWNVFDIINQMILLMAFMFLIGAYFTVDMETNLERKYWHFMDPQLLAEGFFCIGTVMSFLRLLFMCQLNYDIGPMQVSLGKMTGDCAKFTVIFSIILISFTAGLCRLYEYYDGMKQVDPESGVESRQESSFVSSFDTFKVLFWGLFCMSSQEAAEVVIENLPGHSEDSLGAINEHSFTEAVGYILFAGYMVLIVIVILNMLIATMSNTFQRVTDNVDIEWVFGRTEVYLLFMSQTVLPPPFNFLPTGVGSGFLNKICGKYFPQKEIKSKKKVTEEEFASLMSQLLIRYFREKEKDKGG